MYLKKNFFMNAVLTSLKTYLACTYIRIYTNNDIKQSYLDN